MDETHRGRTVNIGDDGLAVIIPRLHGDAVRGGESISFVLALHHVDPATPVRLEGRGIVVRTRDDGDTTLLALRAQWLSTSPLAGAIELLRLS